MDSNHPRLSRRAWLQVAAGAGAAVLAGRFVGVQGQPLLGRAAPATFQNPLFAGDYADPSILRVGRDFYMTHTFYRYAPGLLVWHSRDLVNWTPIASALGQSYGEVWAPDFIEHRGAISSITRSTGACSRFMPPTRAGRGARRLI